jgi:hypothetical protein
MNRNHALNHKYDLRLTVAHSKSKERRKTKRLLISLAIILLCVPMISITLTRARSVGFNASFAAYPPKIDGTVDENEWNSTFNIPLTHGTMLVENDASNLYLLIDLTGDTQEDPPLATSPWGDFFWLAFDVNTDGLITENVDLMYGCYPGTHNLGVQTFLGVDSWTGLNPTASRLGAGFGSSMNSETPHRIWELAISLPEIGATPYSQIRFGLRTYSPNPEINDYQPASFTSSFSHLTEIILARAQIDLLVLSDEGFCDALKPLKTHKDETGINTYIQSWQSLNKSYTAEGRDEPERIKKAIASYQEYCGTRWVMLVGDSDRFPVRYTMTDRGDAAAFDRAFYSADLYYADLYKSDGKFDDWDSNKNGYYGELHGETIAGTLNVDEVNLNPDVAVGRVPASTVSEVTTYVNKVINYEHNAYGSAWFNKALMVATTDWVSDFCLTEEDIVNSSLTDFQTTRLYQAGNPCFSTLDPNSANINNALNQGVGFADYLGHGDPTGWSIPGDWYTSSDLTSLTNANMLPVVFAGACSTSRFTTEPPYSPYTDVYGTHHNGTSYGETFDHVPEQPSPIQAIDEPSCIGEDILVGQDTGAVGYVGCVTGSQPSCRDLDKYFFEAYAHGIRTLGDMWNYMVRRYYEEHVPPATVDPPDWTQLAVFHQPWKFHLFGDPSLRVGGVSTIQKSDFEGVYNMIHDGWNGTLELRGAADAYIEQMPNIIGSYTSADGQTHSVHGYVRTWAYPLPAEWGPDHKIEFYIDFSDTPQQDDDQKFEGYLYTQTKDAIGGITWWNGRPFGFYALKERQASPGISLDSFLGTYSMNHDGWEGTLELRVGTGDYVEQLPNIVGTYTALDHTQHSVRGYVRTATYPLPPEWGPDYKIEFYIDFPDTPQLEDDQKFEGYLFTQTKDAIAGTTLWNDIPFAFYATRTSATPILSAFNLTWAAMNFTVTTYSNSTVKSCRLDQNLKEIIVDITGQTGTTGTCEVTIPKNLLAGNISLYMDSNALLENSDYTHTSNSTHDIYSISYAHSDHTIEIRATEVVPEYGALIAVVPMFSAATLLVTVAARRRSGTKRERQTF